MKCSAKNYIDRTEKYLLKTTPNSHKVKDRLYFEYQSIKYYVDAKNVVLDYSNKEKEIALWLEKTLGGEIYMLPRINKPEGIKTPDYLWNNEYWDLKSINGNSKQVIYHEVYNKKEQSSNFIFDITNSKLSFEDAEMQIKKLYLRKDTKFLNKIIIKKNSDFKIIKRM